MVTTPQPTRPANVIYPDSDGNPMAENTRQFRWIVVIKENLEILFDDDPNVFVAGDLLWYPMEGNNKLRQAPDIMVAFGRPKGVPEASPQENRGSYKQWEEGNIPPQVVFEILSPGNRLKEMVKKQQFYDRYGVEEYYIFDPDRFDFHGWIRNQTGSLELIEQAENWTSPRLGIRFELIEEQFTIYRPDGQRFLTPTELAKLAEQQRLEAQQQRLEAQQQRQEAEQQRQEAQQQRLEAEQQRQEAEQQRQRAELAETRLRELEARLQQLEGDRSLWLGFHPTFVGGLKRG
ncbi:Uma2 family endonuclease [Limnospira sp. Paracas R14]|uniref:Uma2 family endonuclease n=1 Tax=Limnospira sp. Paracas R14 TaxID=2981108 RepID=UPI0028E130E0|nr:Uma2 family endonuclease [Limnospira sp. Paracas R14]